MEHTIAELGLLVRARRDELRLSQQAIEDLWGPTTTTLSKIELGESKSIRRRTAEDLEKSLGWKVGSVEAYLYSGTLPRVVEKPIRPEPPAVEPSMDEPDDSPFMNIRALRDDQQQTMILGVSVGIEPDGVRSRVEVRYWPGDESRSVSMGAFPIAVGEAHRLALEATSVYREPATELEQRRARRTETSEPDESLEPAADDVIEDADEEPGGSEPNE